MLGNVHATVINTADGLRSELTEHLVHGVQWTASVRRMAAGGVTDFVEVGPGPRPLRPHPPHQPRGRDPRGRPARSARLAERVPRDAGVSDRRAVVTGLGVVSPVGIGAEATWGQPGGWPVGHRPHHALRHDRRSTSTWPAR
jgi:hypothetical protein